MMGFWSDIGKAALEGLESHAISQDPSSQERLRDHLRELYAINTSPSKDGFLNGVGHALLVTRKNQEYLSDLPKREVLALHAFVAQQLAKAQAAAKENCYDRNAEDLAEAIEGVSRVIDAYIRDNYSA